MSQELHRTQSIGAFHYDTVNMVMQGKLGPKVDVEHLIQRACARLMEETVEMCLTAGMSTGDIYTAVTDAMHNESLKAKQYPSKFQTRNVDLTNMVVELGDNAICSDFIRHVCAIEQSRLTDYIHTKLDLLRERAKAGELKEVDLNIYKITSGR